MLPWQLDVDFQPTFLPSWWEMQTSGPGGTFSFCSNLWVLISPPLAFNSFYNIKITRELKMLTIPFSSRLIFQINLECFKKNFFFFSQTSGQVNPLSQAEPTDWWDTQAAVWTHTSELEICTPVSKWMPVRIQTYQRGHPRATPSTRILWTHSSSSTACEVQSLWIYRKDHLGARKGDAKCRQLRKYTDHTYKCPAWKERQGWWTHIKTEIILNDTINNLFLSNFQKKKSFSHKICKDIP